MKALRFNSFGEPKAVLRIEEVPKPILQPGEVLIEIRAASINPADAKNVQGSFSQTTLPRIPGRDLAGVVVEGDQKMIGKQVWASGGDVGFTRDGSHAEYIALPAKGAQPKPEGLSMVQAASVGTNYITAYLGLIEKAQLKDRETILVTGANGGVGSSVIKIAKTRGARVVAVDRQAPEGQEIDLSLSSDSDHLLERIEEFTNSKGVDIVFDCVGGPLFETALSSLGNYGRQINITSVGERRVSFDLIDFYRRQLTMFGVNTGLLDTVASGEILERLRPAFEQGQLTPPQITRTCTPEEAIVAYDEIAGGRAKGKIVIVFKP